MTDLQWDGYVRADGRLGVRNLVLVVYTVECASHVAHEIARGEADTHVVGFPGCYDNAYTIRLMLALALQSEIETHRARSATRMASSSRLSTPSKQARANTEPRVLRCSID